MRSRRAEAEQLSPRQAHYLLTGHDELWPGGAGFESEADARAAWNGHRDELLASWIQREPSRAGDATEMRGGPGTRPWAWWRWDATASRHVTESDPGRLAELRAVGYGSEAVWRRDFGRPFGGYVSHEPESAYLSRGKLWLPGEERLREPGPEPVED